MTHHRKGKATSSSSSKPHDQVKPLPPVSVTFLGTSSGGGPILSRNCSSLGVDFGSEIWLVDAADGTLMRLHQSSLRIANISRIFITHLHADHVLGVVAILMTVMSGIGNQPGDVEKLAAQGKSKRATFNIYGPAGLRKLIRTILSITTVNLSGVFAVHELLQADDRPSDACEVSDLHSNEAVGKDLMADADGVWRDIIPEGSGRGGKGWGVSAGPIHHRVPAVGYIFQEPTPRLPLDTSALIPLLQANAASLAALDPPVKHPLSLLSHLTSLPPPAPYTLPSGDVIRPPEASGVQGRKLVIFGDCRGGTENATFQTMCSDPSLLVHECTNAAIPGAIQRGQKGMAQRTKELEPSLEKKREKQFAHLWHKPAKATGDGGGLEHDQGEDLDKDQQAKLQVQKKALGRGHSTPLEVGKFAREIGAKRVVVNHFSAMFPSPRYTTSEPFPSILGPMSPFPYPVPQNLAYASDRPVEPQPLRSGELHTRLIMQSIADQITAIWTAETEAHGAHGEGSASGQVERLAVTARDFMMIHVPAHELSHREQEDIKAYKREAGRVTRQWAEHGGIQVEQQGKKVWLGTSTE
ncbi:hypothetical protein IAU60_004545 [Kwoniella sp. DSM 27419]